METKVEHHCVGRTHFRRFIEILVDNRYSSLVEGAKYLTPERFSDIQPGCSEAIKSTGGYCDISFGNYVSWHNNDGRCKRCYAAFTLSCTGLRLALETAPDDSTHALPLSR